MMNQKSETNETSGYYDTSAEKYLKKYNCMVIVKTSSTALTRRGKLNRENYRKLF